MSSDALILLIIVWVACAVAAGVIARVRGLEVGVWAFLGLVFGVFALIGVLLVKPPVRPTDAAQRTPSPPPSAAVPTGALFCQQCGAALAGDARFCPHCGHPVAAPPVATAPKSFSERYGVPAQAQPVAPPTPNSSSRNAFIIAGTLILLAVVVGFVLVQGRFFSQAGTAGNIPPTGQVWFGSSFDPSTFALSGITISTSTGTSVALVAHLPRSVGSGDMSTRLYYNGTLVANQATNMSGSGDIFGTTVGPFTLSGTFRYEFVDVGGNVLASGDLTVH